MIARYPVLVNKRRIKGVLLCTVYQTGEAAYDAVRIYAAKWAILLVSATH